MSENTPEKTPEELELEQNLKSRSWRLNNLYYITDKDGKVVLFQCNRAQEFFFQFMWYRNIILKARQLGFTTFMMIFMLDASLFRDNTKCAVIAHARDDASRLFREKIKFAYDKLPATIRAMMPATSDRAGEIVFENGSSITVGTSFRGGTLRYLHISEFGKICAKYPEKAKEIVTGAFEAVGKNCVITIESTAEGASGYFYKYSQEAETSKLLGKKLTSLDWEFFFYPWYEDPNYRLESNEAIPQRLNEYFEDLENELGVELDHYQRVWYWKKECTLGADMKREYPSTPKEAFEQIIKGAYYSAQMAKAAEEKRICSVPAEPGHAVHTIWDLGYNDTNAIWFVQRIGREWRIVNYYENNGESMKHYIDKVNAIAAQNYYTLGLHIGPHDLGVHEYSTGKTRKDTAADLGFFFEVAPKLSVVEGIEAVRNIMPMCWWDAANCEAGIVHLRNYRKEWNDKLGIWRDKPLHNDASNGADSFRYLAVSIHLIEDFLYAFAVDINDYTNNEPTDMGGWT